MNNEILKGLVINFGLVMIWMIVGVGLEMPEFILGVSQTYADTIQFFGFLLFGLGIIEIPFGYLNKSSSFISIILGLLIIMLGIYSELYGILSFFIPLGFILLVYTSWACSQKIKIIGLVVGLIFMLFGWECRDLIPPPKHPNQGISSEELYANEDDAVWTIAIKQEHMSLMTITLGSKLYSYKGTRDEAKKYAENMRDKLNKEEQDPNTYYTTIHIGLADIPRLKAAKRGDPYHTTK